MFKLSRGLVIWNQLIKQKQEKFKNWQKRDNSKSWMCAFNEKNFL